MAAMALGPGAWGAAPDAALGLALLLGVALTRAAGEARFAVVPVVLGAAVLSAALLLFPREGEHPVTAAADEIVDTFFHRPLCPPGCDEFGLPWCLFLLLVHHLTEPVVCQATPQELAATGGQ
ncbi:transmembrane protein 218 [Calypte anna]|uniref:transmembrane protein 218 n=1 Tax=Calypte anna TaxID=9244 RepID=UPI0011C482FF|nr:transmembrane protein 218 [Calypte anna]